MKRDSHSRAPFGFGTILSLIGLIGLSTAGSVQAAFILGDASNFAVMYEGAGNNHLAFNNGTIMGDIGIGAPWGTTTAQSQLSGGAANTIIDGNVLFAGATNISGTAGTDYTMTAGHTRTGNNANVQPDLDYLNTLSSALGAEAGTSLAISVGNGSTQTVNASSGMLDGTGNRVFTVTSLSLVNGATLVVNGSASDAVVLNLNFNASFGGTIQLTGGITSDEVLFNIIGGSGLTGGHTLTISTNGAIETGTFLDPNGKIQMNHSVLNGRLFGGDTQDAMVVSGANVFAPVPEPSTLWLLGLAIAGVRVRRSQR